jgi:hypothetical protein
MACIFGQIQGAGLSGRLSGWNVAKYQCGLAIQEYFQRKNDLLAQRG